MILKMTKFKNLMRLIFFLFGSIFLGFSQGASTPQKFNAAVEAGIFYYEEEKAIQKMKVKQKALKYTVKREIIAYNSKIKELSFLKSAELNEVNAIINSTSLDTDRTILTDLRTRIQEVMNPIKDSVKSFETRLNVNLKKQLSNKQYKNWLKYQKRKKREMLPKPPPQPHRSNVSPMNRGMGQRRRY